MTEDGTIQLINKTNSNNSLKDIVILRNKKVLILRIHIFQCVRQGITIETKDILTAYGYKLD